MHFFHNSDKLIEYNAVESRTMPVRDRRRQMEREETAEDGKEGLLWINVKFSL